PMTCHTVAFECGTRSLQTPCNARQTAVEPGDARRIVVPAGNADEPGDPRSACERRESVLRAGTNCKMRERIRLHQRQRRQELRSSDEIRDLAIGNLRLPRLARALAKS